MTWGFKIRIDLVIAQASSQNDELLIFRNAGRPWIKFEPTEAVLAYRHIRARIKEIDKHKLFRMAGEII